MDERYQKVLVNVSAVCHSLTVLILFVIKSYLMSPQTALSAFLDSGTEGMGTNGTHRWLPCKVPSLPNPTTLKGWPHLQGPHPLPFPNSGVGSFTFHRSVKVLGDETHGFSSLSEKTRKGNHLQLSLQRQNFLLSYFKTLSVYWVRSGFEPTTSCSAAWCCPNQANQTAVNKMQGQIYKNDNLDIDWSNTHQSHMFTNYSSYSY